MADKISNSKHKTVKSLASLSTDVVSNKIVSPIVEKPYDLRWPTSQERDLTQITHEETSTTLKPQSNEGNYHDVGNAVKKGAQLKLCPKVCKLYFELLCNVIWKKKV